MSQRNLLGLVVSLAVIVLVAAPFGLAQTGLTGEWTASVNQQDEGKLHLNLTVRNEDQSGDRGNRHQMGQSYNFSELQGLSREQALAGGAVKFSLVREAGTIECEGSFQNDGTQKAKGSGTFRFTSNPAFLTAMKSRGYDFESDSNRHGDTEDRLFTATALNITTALADDLNSAGFGKLGVEDLFKAAIFKVDSKFMREMKASGFPNLGMEDLVKARIFKIDADFVKQTAQLGFDKEPFESLVKMQIFKVTPEFIAEVRNEGLTNVTVEDLVKLRIFKIDAQYIRKVRAEGGSLDVESIVQRRIHNRDSSNQ